jgi:PAS domain S-box-containing protein
MPLEGDAVREALALFREKLLEITPAGIYTCDAEGLITYFNRRAVQVWGREPKLNHPKDRFCGSFKLFSADGSPVRHDQCWMALALQTDQPYDNCEIVIERPDGSRMTALAHAHPLHDEAGKLIGAVNVLVDITERKQGEEARARLAAIVESADDAIVSKDLDGVITSWNGGAERLFGYTVQEAIGQPVTMLFPPDRLDEELSILERIRRGESIEHYETVRRRKDGSLLDISLTVSPIVDSQGRIIGASKVARDITERKRQEALVRQLSAPVLQVREQVLLLPLVGVVDEERAALLRDRLLHAIRADRARAVVIDVTGAAMVDAQVGQELLHIAEASRLLGAKVILTGVSTEVAQTFVKLGVEMDKLHALGNLQDGIQEATRLVEQSRTSSVSVSAGRGVTLPLTPSSKRGR